jgi:hypothetical protein
MRLPWFYMPSPRPCWNAITNILWLSKFFEKFTESFGKAKMARWHVIDICSNDRTEESMVQTSLPKLQLTFRLREGNLQRKVSTSATSSDSSTEVHNTYISSSLFY